MEVLAALARGEQRSTVPATLGSMVLERVRRSGADVDELLQSASVIGMHPTASAAIATRPSSRVARNCAKPRPRSPSRLASGTRQSVKVSGWVSEACQPSLS